jgi:hypothetical protein
MGPISKNVGYITPGLKSLTGIITLAY